MMVVSHDRAFLQAIGITRTLLVDGGRVREVDDLAAAEAVLAATNRLDRSRSIL
jgi:ATPase subunit of ABC transporter with duplicated ATPase domains